jgi:hypothetical protein
MQIYCFLFFLNLTLIEENYDNIRTFVLDIKISLFKSKISRIIVIILGEKTEEIQITNKS